MNFTIYEKVNNLFSLDMSYYEGNELNNENAIDKRFCMILIEEGSGILNLNNVNVPFIAPTLFCVNEKENVIIDKSLNVKIKVVFFHPRIVNSILDFENIRVTPEYFTQTIIQDCYLFKHFINRSEDYYGKINISQFTYKRLDLLVDLFNRESSMQNRDNWPCRSRSYIMEILFLLDSAYIENDSYNDTFNKDIDEDLYSIILYLYNNYNRKITITELTDKFNINRTTLSEKFTKYIGETIITYLNKLRINMASTILRDTKVPIYEVMERVGFTDYVHFSRTFKKYKGMSPKEYRNNYCWMN